MSEPEKPTLEEDETSDLTANVENFIDLLPRIDTEDEEQVLNILQSLVDRLLKQERELEKYELKCRAYEKIIRAHREKRKSHVNSIDNQHDQQVPKENHVPPNRRESERSDRHYRLRQSDRRDESDKTDRSDRNDIDSHR
jgi:hypothetical protein